MFACVCARGMMNRWDGRRADDPLYEPALPDRHTPVMPGFSALPRLEFVHYRMLAHCLTIVQRFGVCKLLEM